MLSLWEIKSHHFFNVLFMKLTRSHDLNFCFNVLTRVDSFIFFALFYFIIQDWIA